MGSTSIIVGYFNCHDTILGCIRSEGTNTNLVKFIETTQVITLSNDGSITRIDPNPKRQDSANDITMLTSDLAGSHWKIMEDTISNNLPIIINIGTKRPWVTLPSKPCFNFQKAIRRGFKDELVSYTIERREDKDYDRLSTRLTKSLLKLATKHIANYNMPTYLLIKQRILKNKSPYL